MKKSLFVFILIVSVFGAVSSACAKKADTQYWKTESLTWEIAKDWKLGLEEEMRFQDDASDLYYQHTKLSVLYSGWVKWFDLGLAFQHTLSEKSSVWKREEWVQINPTLKLKWKGWSLNNRFRTEHRFREDADDAWRYRNNIEVRPPLKWTRLEIQPFIADEVYYDFDLHEVTENRLFEGFSFKLTKRIGMDIYYLWRRVKSSGRWSSNNVIGTRLKLTF